MWRSCEKWSPESRGAGRVPSWGEQPLCLQAKGEGAPGRWEAGCAEPEAVGAAFPPPPPNDPAVMSPRLGRQSSPRPWGPQRVRPSGLGPPHPARLPSTSTRCPEPPPGSRGPGAPCCRWTDCATPARVRFQLALTAARPLPLTLSGRLVPCPFSGNTVALPVTPCGAARNPSHPETAPPFTWVLEAPAG